MKVWSTSQSHETLLNQCFAAFSLTIIYITFYIGTLKSVRAIAVFNLSFNFQFAFHLHKISIPALRKIPLVTL